MSDDVTEILDNLNTDGTFTEGASDPYFPYLEVDDDYESFDDHVEFMRDLMGDAMTDDERDIYGD